MLVDNSDHNAIDAPNCGAGGFPPCRTIGWGVTRALSNSGTAEVQVSVRGPGPYLGECFNSTSGDERGIVIPNITSLAVVGLNASSGGKLVGAPLIDCEGKGRAFTFGDIWARGMGPQLTLEGLRVRNGTTNSGSLFQYEYQGSGGAVWMSGGSLLLRRCSFEDCSAPGNAYGSCGGAVFAIATAHVVVEDSNFTRCSAGYGGGGAVMILFYEGTIGVTNTFSGNRFESTKSDRSGGAVNVFFAKGNRGAVSRNATTTIANCTFERTRTGGIQGHGGGGAVSAQFIGAVSGVTTTISASNFTNCTAPVGHGGAIAVTHARGATSSTTTITGCNLLDNEAGGAGGALALSAAAGSTGVSLVVARCELHGNSARNSSGGALSIVLPLESPQNLFFVGNPKAQFPPSDRNDPCSNSSCSFPNCGSCPVFMEDTEEQQPFAVIPHEHEFRTWDHVAADNTFALHGNAFVGNCARLSGGAISVPRGGAGAIEGCNFSVNNATEFFGGGTYVGGTVALNVSNSHWRDNTCGQDGCQLYSSSGAAVAFTHGSSIALGCAGSDGGSGNCLAGVAAPESGNWTWDNESSMSCLPGYELVNSSTIAFNQKLDGWQLKAPVTIPRTCAFNVTNGTFDECPIADNVTNCPCYFSDRFGFGSATVVSPAMLVSTLSFACRPCASGQYSLTTPQLHGNGQKVIATCTDCPYGGSCHGADNISAAAGFWGDARQNLSFSRCPSGYCCGGRATPCVIIDGCAGNRGGVLCGSCAKGFVQTVGSTACRATAECGSADAVWFMPGAVLLASLFALYARKSQTDGSCGFPLNSVSITAFYYQMAQLLPVGVTTAVENVFAGLSNMQLNVGSGDGFACPFASLTTVHAIELQYAVPALVLLMLAVGHYAEARKTTTSNATLRQQYQGALFKVATLAYSTLLGTTFQLLHCIELGAGGARVLFRAATQACGATWQAPFFALAFALLLPVAVALAAAAGVGAAAKLTLPAPLAAKLRAPYRDGCGHWEAVLALHRLAVVVVYSFGVGAVAAVLQTLICVIALMAHQTRQPFRKPSANRAQTALLSLLALVALLNVPQAVLDTNARAESRTVRVLTRQLREVEAVLLLAPTLVLGTALLAMAWQRRVELAHKVSTDCAAALVHCSCIAGARAAGEEGPLDELLLPDPIPSPNRKLVSNSRGVRLTYRTPVGKDEDEGHDNADLDA